MNYYFQQSVYKVKQLKNFSNWYFYIFQKLNYLTINKQEKMVIPIW